ncbi:MAG: iron-containing alcohol dehydrogenase, partial [Chloroflexi bacterium]|nr:iron-containing alcohol dehydrogenase [Chloroflexota bacterium]
MENFVYQNPTKILFGRGMEEHVGEETASYSKKVLLHYGGGSIKSSGLYDRITASLKKAGVEWVELAGVKPNPRLSLVYEGIKLVKENNLGLILAVGGGSVIDSAKAIAMGAVIDGDVWD